MTKMTITMTFFMIHFQNIDVDDVQMSSNISVEIANKVSWSIIMRYLGLSQFCFCLRTCTKIQKEKIRISTHVSKSFVNVLKSRKMSKNIIWSCNTKMVKNIESIHAIHAIHATRQIFICDNQTSANNLTWYCYSSKTRDS